MKKITALLVSLLLILCMGTTVFAKDVTISTTVPERHLVSIEVDGGGKVVANHQVCGSTILVERQSRQAYWLIPDAGKVLSALYYDGEDVTAQVKVGVFTAPALTDDATMRAVFTDAPVPSDDTGYDVSGTITGPDGKPVPGATVDIGGQTGITDENGNFSIEDVTPGTHTVTVTDENGDVIGVGEITIEAPEGDQLSTAADSNGNPVITPGSGTTSIELNMQIDEDGIISITDVEDSTDYTTKQPSQAGSQTTNRPGSGTSSSSSGSGNATATGSPTTGDPTNLTLWLSLFAVSICGIAGAITAMKRKNTSVTK